MEGAVATAIVLAGVGCLFCAACASIVRVSYFDGRPRFGLPLALYRTASFSIAIVGCLALSDLYGDGAAAMFAAGWCAFSLALGAMLSRSWRATEERERSRVSELRALVDRYRSDEDSVEARCARAARAYELTRREEDMLGLLLEGRTRSEMARELVVSPDTVKTHLRNLYRKMGVAGKDELVDALAARASR